MRLSGGPFNNGSFQPKNGLHIPSDSVSFLVETLCDSESNIMALPRLLAVDKDELVRGIFEGGRVEGK